MKYLSLKQKLTLPYIVLVLLLTASLGTLFFSAWRVATNNFAEQLLSEITQRIAAELARPAFDSSRTINSANQQLLFATDSAMVADQLLGSLRLTANGIAYIAQADGSLLGTSRGSTWRQATAGQDRHLHVEESGEPLLISSHRLIHGKLTRTVKNTINTTIYQMTNGEEVAAAYTYLRSATGVDLLAVVAMPRHELLQSVQQQIERHGAMALLVVLTAIALGSMVCSSISSDFQELAEAARRAGNGDIETPFNINRDDELGEIARGFQKLQTKLASDRLTGLANRDAFTRRVEERIDGQAHLLDRRPFAILFIDLNDFKNINDNYGHAVGDRVLQEIAQRMLNGLRSRDLVARYAGDEFVVMLDAVNNLQDAEHARHNLEKMLCGSLRSIASTNESTSASVGLAMYPADGENVPALVQHADADMYRRKQARANDALADPALPPIMPA